MKRGSGWLMAIALLGWLPALVGSHEAVWAAGLALLGLACLAVRSGGEWRELPWWCWLAGWLVVLLPPVLGAVSPWAEAGWRARLVAGDPEFGGVVATWPFWLESWSLGLLTVFWVWLLAALPLDRSLRRSGVRWLAAVGLATLLLGAVDIWVENGLVTWWGFDPGGPFANRNQFGLVTALTGVACAALAWEDAARGRAGAMGWGVCFLLAAGVLVLIGSRGAFAGCLVGLCAVGAARMARKAGAVGPVAGFSAVVGLFGLTVVALAYRPLARWFDGEGWSADARWALFQDVGAMIREQPWTGVGLAGFRLIYPAYREALEAAAPVLHPESDMLWWMAELGWPAVLLIGLVLLLGGWSERRQGDALLFSVACGAAATALVHGTVDVGLHRPGSFLPLLTVIGLWAGQLRGGERMAYPGPFRVLTVCGGALAGLWLMAAGAGWVPGERWLIRAKATLGAAEMEPTIALEQGLAALRWSPLDPVLNFQTGWLLSNAGETGDRGKVYLERARRWAPHDPAVSFESGRLWLERDPVWALAAWRETLTRSKGNTFDEWFNRMEKVTQGRPGLREGLYFHFADLPGLDYVRMERARPGEAEALAAEILAGEVVAWEGRPMAQRRLVSGWVAHEGGARVAGLLRGNRAFEDLFWRPVAVAWARSDPRAATAYALEMLEVRRGELVAPTLEEVRADRIRLRTDPGVEEAAIRVALAERAAGNPEGALELLAKVGPTEEAARTRAAALLDLGRGEEAWAAIGPVVERSGDW